jgi:hypothetical protein
MTENTPQPPSPPPERHRLGIQYLAEPFPLDGSAGPCTTCTGIYFYSKSMAAAPWCVGRRSDVLPNVMKPTNAAQDLAEEEAAAEAALTAEAAARRARGDEHETVRDFAAVYFGTTLETQSTVGETVGGDTGDSGPIATAGDEAGEDLVRFPRCDGLRFSWVKTTRVAAAVTGTDGVGEDAATPTAVAGGWSNTYSGGDAQRYLDNVVSFWGRAKLPEVRGDVRGIGGECCLVLSPHCLSQSLSGMIPGAVHDFTYHHHVLMFSSR